MNAIAMLTDDHRAVKKLLTELESTTERGVKTREEQENTEHHIEDEEGEMFKKARQVFDDAELDALGNRLAARRANVTRETSGAAR